MAELQVDDLHSSTFRVETSDLADAISLHASDRFPAVLATSRLVAFMEITSARQLQAYLLDGQLSVGVRVDITHSAPTPAGADVVVVSRFIGKEGKIFVFDIVVHDSGGEVGKARHTRAIVDAERLQKGAQKRMTNSAI